ncbi:MAG: YraN family protein [Candidatus Moraniibacteriota bacterium]|nr:MAG: YraN family protein [Candidatus Moranbacteria bacterium]
MWRNLFLKSKSFKKDLKKRGCQGENDACVFLKGKGYKIIERNFRNSKGYSLGEIDIIACKDNYLVFFEVKAGFGLKKDNLPPEMNITKDKLRKLHRIISCYLKEHPQWNRTPFSLDAIIITYDENENLKNIRHLEHIFL